MENKTKEFIEVSRQLNKQMKKFHPPGDLNPGEYFMLSKIADYCGASECGEGIMVSKLAQILDISNASVSKMLRILEEKNYINREMHTKDRRVIFVTLTDEGKRIVQRSRDTLLEVAERITAQLGDEDLEQFIYLMKKLSGILQDNIGNTEE